MADLEEYKSISQIIDFVYKKKIRQEVYYINKYGLYKV